MSLSPNRQRRPATTARPRPVRWSMWELMLLTVSLVLIGSPLLAAGYALIEPTAAPAAPLAIVFPTSVTTPCPDGPCAPPTFTAVPPVTNTPEPPTPTATATTDPAAPTPNPCGGGGYPGPCCAGSAYPDPQATPCGTETPTPVATDTATPGPTDTPAPTSTPAPTDTPAPTSTAAPTSTPAPRALAVTKEALGLNGQAIASITVGSEFLYSITVENGVPSAVPVQLDDALPAGVDGVAVVAVDNGTCSITARVLSCTLQPSQGRTATVLFRVVVTAADGASLANVATATTSTESATGAAGVVLVTGGFVPAPPATPAPPAPTSPPATPAPPAPTGVPGVPAPTGVPGVPAPTGVPGAPAPTSAPGAPAPPAPPRNDPDPATPEPAPATPEPAPAEPAPATPEPAPATPEPAPATPEPAPATAEPAPPAPAAPTATAKPKPTAKPAAKPPTPTKAPVIKQAVPTATNVPAPTATPLPTATPGPTMQPVTTPAPNVPAMRFNLDSDWGQVFVGDTFEYEVTLQNAGAGAGGTSPFAPRERKQNLEKMLDIPSVDEVLIADDINPLFEIVEATASGMQVKVVDQRVEATRGTLAGGETVTLRIKVRARPVDVSGKMILNQATLRYKGVGDTLFSNIVAVKVVMHAAPTPTARPTETATPTATPLPTATPEPTIQEFGTQADLPHTSGGAPLYGVVLLGLTMLMHSLRVHRSRFRI